MLLNEFLEQSAEKFPDKIALVFQDKRLSFLEIENLANRLARALKDFGLMRQDRAAVYLESSVESVVSIFGILKAGGIFLLLNPQLKAKKFYYILNDCEVKFLITDTDHFKEISDVSSKCPSLKKIIMTDYESLDLENNKVTNLIISSYSNILNDYPSKLPPKQCIDEDLASLIYTSGTTGYPKGVMCTHLNMVSAASSIIEYLGNTPEDIILNVLPLSFDYGLYQVLMAFKFGGTVVLEKSFLYPGEIINLLAKEKVTGFPIVPTIAGIFLRLKNLNRHNFSSVRYITSTGQALPSRYIPEMLKLFPNAGIYSMYGLTECKRVSFLPPEEIKKRPTSVGMAMPDTEAFIVDDQGKKIMKSGEIGELVVCGSNVMKGYWNLPEETDKYFKPGPIPGKKILYTGDLFRMDEEGFLYFVSRKDDVIKVAGERVSPKEIENVIYDIEGVNEAAAVGVDDEILGQAVKVFVSLNKNSNLTKDDILRHCSRNMENFMVPKYVEIMDELPKSSHGKINKKELKLA